MPAPPVTPHALPESPGNSNRPFVCMTKFNCLSDMPCPAEHDVFFYLYRRCRREISRNGWLSETGNQNEDYIYISVYQFFICRQLGKILGPGFTAGGWGKSSVFVGF
jgi:hypothetical protein